MFDESKNHFAATLYTKRWLMLALFCWCSASNSYHWIHLNIISDRILFLWNASIPGEGEDMRQMALDWLSMIYLLAYIPLIVPATWLLDRCGLRVSTLLAASLNALGAWIKCISGTLTVDPATHPFFTFNVRSAFPILMFAQTLDAIAQVFILGVPAQLASTWFGDDEVSTATSVGVLANQLGVAFGFCFPAMVVPSLPGEKNQTGTLHYPWIAKVFGADIHETADKSVFESVKYCTMILLYIGAVFTTLPLIPVLFLFKANPPTEPTYAQYHRNQLRLRGQDASKRNHDYDRVIDQFPVDRPRSGSRFLRTNQVAPLTDSVFTNSMRTDLGVLDQDIAPHGGYKQSVVRVLRNTQFLLLFFSYGINTGVYYALGTLLNFILMDYFPGDVRIGWIGFTMVVSGVIGSIIAGIALDRSKKFKLINCIIYLLTLVSMAVFTAVLQMSSISLIFVISFVLGFTMTGFLPLGFEFAAELTYPENEGLTSGLLNASAQLFGIIFTLSASQLKSNFGALAGNLLMTLVILIGFVMMLAIKEDLRRQKMQRMASIQLQEQINNELNLTQI